jgi:hypothetical protein
MTLTTFASAPLTPTYPAQGLCLHWTIQQRNKESWRTGCCESTCLGFLFVYLTTVYQLHKLTAQNEKIIVKDELGKMWKEQVMTCVGLEVLTAVVMKSPIFWDITPCSRLKISLRFGWTCRLHLQQDPLAIYSILVSCWHIFQLWRWKRHGPPKRPLAFKRLLGVTSQKIGLFKLWPV